MSQQNKRAEGAQTPSNPAGQAPRLQRERGQQTKPSGPVAAVQHSLDPRAVLRQCAGLNKAELGVLVALVGFADREGIAWPNTPLLAARAGCHRSNAQKAIASLRARGYIRTDLRHEGACRASCAHWPGATPDKYPNGVHVKRQALVFQLVAPRLRVIQGGKTGCTVQPTPRCGEGEPPAVASGNPPLWRGGTPRCGEGGLPYSELSQGNLDPLTHTLDPVTSRAREPSPGGCAPPPVNPPTPRDPDPEGMVFAPCAGLTSGSPSVLGSDDASPAPPPSTLRPRARESTTRAARAVLAYWRAKLAPTVAVCHTTARLDIVRSALTRHSAHTLGAVIAGAARSKWHTDTPRNTTVAFLFRSDQAIRDMAEAGRAGGFRRLPDPGRAPRIPATERSPARADSVRAMGCVKTDTELAAQLETLTKLSLKTQKQVDK